MEELISELTKLSLTRFPWIRHTTRYELTFWNLNKVPADMVLNSWAFQGDVGKSDDDMYWKNTARLLGNDLGYPTRITHSKHGGTWSLNLVININGVSSPTFFSMAGGTYNHANPQDLDSILYVKSFLEEYIGRPMFHPDGKQVSLERVRLVTGKARAKFHGP